MPLLKIETTVAVSDDKRKTLLPSLSKIAAKAIGKSEEYVMVTVSPATILMSGKPGDAAFVEIRSIGGLSGDVNRELSQKLCSLLSESLGVPQKSDLPQLHGYQGQQLGLERKNLWMTYMFAARESDEAAAVGFRPLTQIPMKF